MTGLQIRYGSVQIFDDALPQDLYKELLLAKRRVGWQWGWNTPSNSDSRYWHHEVGRGRKANTEDVSHFVRQHPIAAYARYMDWLRTHLVPADTKVLRFYLNGHTYGTDGWPHTDTDRGEELTGVLYLNAEWKPEWCGETVVFDGNGDIEAAVLPRANRLLVFPSDRVHAPRPLSKAFDGLRVVLVVKMASPSGRGADFTR
jgi:SM-20-related protein